VDARDSAPECASPRARALARVLGDPLFFPAVEIEGNWYADGSIRLSTPLSPAIRMGAKKIRDRGAHATIGETRPADRAQYPTTAETVGVLLNALFSTRSSRTSSARRASIRRWDCSRPRSAPRQLTPLILIEGARAAAERRSAPMVFRDARAPITVRHLFRGLARPTPRLGSQLSRVRGRVHAALGPPGHQDTIARADELARSSRDRSLRLRLHHGVFSRARAPLPCIAFATPVRISSRFIAGEMSIFASSEMKNGSQITGIDAASSRSKTKMAVR
jgi:hypothetical protein